MPADLPFRSWEKRLSLAVRSAPLRTLLKELLREWRYQVLPSPSPGDLLIVENGAEPPAGDGPLLRLGQNSSDPSLALPLAVESLWIALEELFHSPARRHIRIPLHTPVGVRRRGAAGEQILLSLSDQGGSFEYDGEPEKGEILSLALQAGEERHLLEGKVIYVVFRGGAGSEVGVVFDLPGEERERLRALIVASYLERVRERMPEEVFREGLTFLRLPGGEWPKGGVLR